MKIKPLTAVILLLCVTFGRNLAASEYLGNNQRSGYTDTKVPTRPVLLWTYHERHAPKTAWPEPFGELQFIDFDYTPQALDLKTGEPKLVAKHPLTGNPSQFQLSGQNFCGMVSAGNHK